MAYSKHTWVNNQTPAINATNLNEVEDGINLAHTLVVAESTEREASDIALNTKIDTEITNRTTAVTTVTGLVTTEATTRASADSSLQNNINIANGRINTINTLIPAQATALNQLADKDFVNSSVASSTGTFVGTFDDESELPSTANINDYAFVQGVDAYDRYKYTASGWLYEYTLNNSSFTAEQWNAINSGMTDTEVAKITDLVTEITEDATNDEIPSAKAVYDVIGDISSALAQL